MNPRFEPAPSRPLSLRRECARYCLVPPELDDDLDEDPAVPWDDPAWDDDGVWVLGPGPQEGAGDE